MDILFQKGSALNHADLGICTHLCKFIVASWAGQAEETFSFLCVFVDAASLVQQFAHGVDIAIWARLR